MRSRVLGGGAERQQEPEKVSESPEEARTNFFDSLDISCFYAVTSFLFVNELPRCAAVSRRFRQLTESDDCLARNEGLTIDDHLSSMVKDPLESRSALVARALHLQSHSPKLRTLVLSCVGHEPPTPLLEKVIRTNSPHLKSLWVYSGAGGYATVLQGCVSWMHELQDAGLIGVGMDTIFVKNFLRQLLLISRSKLRRLSVGVGDTSVDCLRRALADTGRMQANSESIFASLQDLYINMGEYPRGLLFLANLIEAVKKGFEKCRLHLEGTLVIRSYPAVSLEEELQGAAGTSGGAAQVEDVYNAVLGYNLQNAEEGSTSLCSKIDENVLYYSFSLPRQDAQPGRSEAETNQTCSPEGLVWLSADRLVEFRIELSACETSGATGCSSTGVGGGGLQQRLVSTFCSDQQSILNLYNKTFVNRDSLPVVAVHTHRPLGDLPSHIRQRFTTSARSFASVFDGMILEVPMSLLTEVPQVHEGSERHDGQESQAAVAAAATVLDILGEGNLSKFSGIQLDLSASCFSTKEAGIYPYASSVKSIVEYMGALGMGYGSLWLLVLKCPRNRGIEVDVKKFIEMLINANGEPAAVEWIIQRNASFGEPFFRELADQIQLLDFFLHSCKYKRHEWLSTWWDFIIYTKS
ncbi:hypothetical protein BESB_055360 [Besnoitia besnoiti]|uniref:F-box domain-containing protein n=1 Tax=Besnoitia besnoiti TaxID=94643 RepID=A0A2A9MD14_BESBE|nr:hypothetical protein BESB_055360 [Besnoitia besnoiti]PFH35885.1 hypothetical protein BESB_055360 [Besnoitia besnoiti]